jgi:hypothetical protein
MLRQWLCRKVTRVLLYTADSAEWRGLSLYVHVFNNTSILLRDYTLKIEVMGIVMDGFGYVFSFILSSFSSYFSPFIFPFPS